MKIKKRAAEAAQEQTSYTNYSTDPKGKQSIFSIKKLRKNIPKKMQRLAQWIFWKAEERNGKVTKVPCNESGYAVDCTLVEHHRTFEAVLNGMRKTNGKVNGIGFVFMENGISGIDVDHCIDESGKMSASARAIIDEFGSYTEISPSGRGIHIIVKGDLPERVRGDNKYLGGKNGDYEAYSSGRFFTVTGDVLTGRTSLNRRVTKLEWFWNTYVRAPTGNCPANAAAGLTTKPSRSLEQIMSRIARSSAGDAYERLMRGDISAFPSHSEADLKLLQILAPFCRNDPELMEQMFNKSELSKRKKWRTRNDYRAKTITKAIELTSKADSDNSTGKTLQTYSAAELEHREIPVIQWLIPDFLPEGFALLAGKPKKGKSWMALNIAMACATGGTFFNRNIAKKDVLYVALEDGERRLKDRLNKLCHGKCAFPTSLHIADASQFATLHSGGLSALFEYLDMHNNFKLVIIDTIGRIMPRQTRQGSQYHHEYDFTAMLQKESVQRGICILAIAHTRKADSEDPFDAVSGTLGLTGSADTIWVLKSSPSEKASALLHITGREVTPDKFALRFYNGVWTMLGNAEDIAISEPRSKIIEFLRESGEQSPKEISKGLKTGDGTVRRILLNMKRDGQILRSVHGKYSLAPTSH